jgi:hypothetical protein
LDVNEVAAMALPRSSPTKLASNLILVAVLLLTHRCAAEEDIMLDQKIELIWGASHTYFFMDGDTETLALSLDEQKGSCFRSLDMYLFSRIDVDIKLVEGNSAGTVATVYVRSLSFCCINRSYYLASCSIIVCRSSQCTLFFFHFIFNGPAGHEIQEVVLTNAC